MEKKITPFWLEGMTDEERDHQIFTLFALLEQKFDTVHKAIDVPTKRTFVFVPDPPPLIFEVQTQSVKICRFSWGVAGRAAATESVQMAAALAPIMFDLWSDSLYIIAFESEIPDVTTLGRWIAEVLRTEFDVAPSDKMQVPLLPIYALMVFEWGDLIGWR